MPLDVRTYEPMNPLLNEYIRLYLHTTCKHDTEGRGFFLGTACESVGCSTSTNAQIQAFFGIESEIP